jgi:hypothetical protein
MFVALPLLAALGCAQGGLSVDALGDTADTGVVDTYDTAEPSWTVPTEGLFVHSPRWVDEAEAAEFPHGNLRVILENLGPDDHMAYPSVIVRADHPAVAGLGGTYQLYGIFADQQVETGWQVDLSRVPSGTRVIFTAEVSALGCPSDDPATCPPPRPITFERWVD